MSISIWILHYREVLKRIFFGNHQEKRDATAVATTFYDHLATTELMMTNARDICKALDHECTEANRNHRQPPILVDEQALRYFRHKKGYEHQQGVIARCPHCLKAWTYEEIVSDLMVNEQEMRQVGTPNNKTKTPEEKSIPKARLHATIVQYQKNRSAPSTPVKVIRAAYQHHSSKHVKGCFPCNKIKKRNHKCDSECECRFCLPDRKRRKTQIRTLEEKKPWFTWSGGWRDQALVEFLPRRSSYDVFQNISCKAISESKFSCNSNISLITDGPV